MGEGQLGHVFGAGDELAGERVGGHLERLGDEDAQRGVRDDHVEGDQGVQGVFIGLGDEQGALQGLAFQQRGFDFDRADLGGRRAAGAEGRSRLSRARSASEQTASPSAWEGLTVIPRGRVTIVFSMSESAPGAGVGVGQAFIGDVEAEVKPAGALGGQGAGAGVDRRAEAERPAAAQGRARRGAPRLPRPARRAPHRSSAAGRSSCAAG